MTEDEIREMKSRQRDTSASEMMFAMMGCLDAAARAQSSLLTIAATNMAAMLANPNFEPSTEKGETRFEATARRAADYADALIAEVKRREAQQAGGGQ